MQGDELVILRKQRLIAIANCDFAKARAIDLQMQRLSSEINDLNASQLKMENQMEYERIKESIRSNATQELNKAYQNIFDTRCSFQQRKVKLLESHSKHMEYIAEEYSKDLEMCTLRQVPDSEILKKEAQIQAKFGNYDAAEELFAMSTSTREMTLQQRQENVHNFYERLQEHVEQRHADELALNDEKRMKEFNDIKIHYNKEIERMRKVLANSSMKLQVEQNFEEEDEIFKELIIDVEDENEMPKMEPSPKSSPKAVTPTKLSPRPSLSPKPTLPPKSPKPAISPKPAASPRSLVSRTLASARQKAAAKSPKSQMSPAAKRKTAPPASPSQ